MNTQPIKVITREDPRWWPGDISLETFDNLPPIPDEIDEETLVFIEGVCTGDGGWCHDPKVSEVETRLMELVDDVEEALDAEDYIAAQELFYLLRYGWEFDALSAIRDELGRRGHKELEQRCAEAAVRCYQEGVSGPEKGRLVAPLGIV